ncbi:MAG: hypothetical protein H5T50_01060 [Nitrososphaeria archaeon]|nr:hypothetical protein [Nitrososphaeria archaeon]
MPDKIELLGIGLTVFSPIFATLSYILLSNIPLTALGIGLTVLGLTILLTPQHPVPKETVQTFIRSSCENLETLLEATGAFMKATYFPSNGKVYAYIPVTREQNIVMEDVVKNVGNLISKSGRSLGLIIVPPASELLKNSVGEGAGYDAVASEILVEASEVVESVKVVESDSTIVLEIFRPRVDINFSRFRTVMGSLPTSIAAQAAAIKYSKPVQVLDESFEGNRIISRLKVLEWTGTPYT